MKSPGAIVFTLFLLLVSSIIAPIVYSSEPQNATAMWIEPSILFLDPEWLSVGYKFYLTLWANASVHTDGWAFEMRYPNTYINATRTAYTAGEKSEFYQDLATTPYPPLFEPFNATHNSLIHCEGLGPAHVFRDPGYGSLCWVEFEIVELPPADQVVEMPINIEESYYDSPCKTWMIDQNSRKKAHMKVFNALIRIEEPPPSAPPPPPPPPLPPPIPPPPPQPDPEPHEANAMWIEPLTSGLSYSEVHVGYKFNATVWANTSVGIRAWQFRLLFNDAYFNVTRVGYTADEKSIFFYYQPTLPVTPDIRPNWNGTHSRIDFAEGAGIHIIRPPGFGSLAWIEFEITNLPQENETIEIPLDMHALDRHDRPYTYLIDPNQSKLELDIYNGMVKFAEDASPPVITVHSPESQTYTSTVSIQPIVTTDEATSWMGCSLDGNTPKTLTDNLTLDGLSQGPHSIKIYANDTAGNLGVSSTIHFLITFATDLTLDRAVDISDIVRAAEAFGSNPDHPRWNPLADLDGNYKISIVDIALVARDFGKMLL